MKTVSMRGKVVDMSLLMSQNEQKVALGNANMNARGDVIGPNGQIVKTREQITQEYNASNPRAVKQVSLKDLNDEVFVTPAEAVAEIKSKQQNPETSETLSATAPTSHRKRKTEDRED